MKAQVKSLFVEDPVLVVTLGPDGYDPKFYNYTTGVEGGMAIAVSILEMSKGTKIPLEELLVVIANQARTTNREMGLGL